MATLPHTLAALPSGTLYHHYPNPGVAKAMVILQHGFGDYSERWVRDYPFIVQDLHALCIDVYAMDLWGHGESPGERSIVHVGKAVEDYTALRMMIENPQRLPIYLLGHSLGGLIVAGSSSKCSENVAGVVMVAPALADPMSSLVRYCVRMIARILPTWKIPQRQSPIDTLTKDTEMIQKWCTDKGVFHGQISFLVAASALEVATTLWKSTEGWTIPTLTLHGDKDTYTDHRQSQKFVARIRSPVKQFYLSSNGFHDLFSDDAEVWRQIIVWIKSRLDALAQI